MSFMEMYIIGVFVDIVVFGAGLAFSKSEECNYDDNECLAGVVLLSMFSWLSFIASIGLLITKILRKIVLNARSK